jgi:hypothetical protein
MVEPNKRVDRLAREVISAAIEVHLHLGLFINFNVPVLKAGIQRAVFSWLGCPGALAVRGFGLELICPWRFGG